jgi:hypothetical protein
MLGATALAELSDPYEILEKNYEAVGGLDKLKAQTTSYTEGTIVIEGTGLGGSFKEWSELPIRKRQEVDLTIMKQTSGDNGEHAWSVDQNGKVHIHSDEKTINERKMQQLMAKFDHLNRNSENFAITFEGSEKVGEKDCYVVMTLNTLTPDTLYQYFDMSSFHLLKMITKSQTGESHTLFSDYREVDGILAAFGQDMTEFPTRMKTSIRLTKLETKIRIDPALFEPPEGDVQDFKFANGKSAENIPFQFIENHIYLSLTVGGITRLWVLDSGASVTVIESEFAKELGLELEGSLKGRGAGNLVDVAFTKMPAFNLPGLEFNEQQVASIAINWLFEKWVGFKIGGILGYDFLSRLVIKVDYANEMLSFYLPDSFSYSGEGTVIDAPISQSNMFFLPLTVDGKYGDKWNLDLGAGGMSFHYPFAVENGFLELPGIDGVGHGAGGSQMKRSVQFKTIEFAGFVKENPIIGMPTEKGEGGFSSSELSGNIGNTLLRHFVLYLDYKREQVIVEKGDDYDRVFPRDNSGVQLEQSEDGKLQVLFVSDNTPGLKAGFKPGDIIHSVNGIETEYIGGIVALKKMLREDPGTSYSVTVQREGIMKKLDLTLDDLYQ